MAFILNIETSTPVCSVSISDGKKVVAYRENKGVNDHAKCLSIFIDEALEEAKINFKDLAAVSVSKGPGSYTGLRIGTSTAKGICYGKGIPLLGISSLEVIAAMAIDSLGKTDYNLDSQTIICPMIDARRMEVYCCMYNSNFEIIKNTCAEIINENSFEEYVREHKIVFAGNGAEKCKSFFSGERFVFLDGVYPSAEHMASASFDQYNKQQFLDVAYFEPDYLKEFVTTTPKSKL